MSKQKEKKIIPISPEIRSSLAEKEARFLLWCFSKDEASKHIERNLARSNPLTENDSYKFWKEVEVAFSAIIAGEDNELEECSHLLDFVNSMKPRRIWVAPLLDSIVFKDFRTRLFTIIEDYRNERSKCKDAVNRSEDDEYR